MLIRLNDHWYVDAALVSAVTYNPEGGEIGMFFHNPSASEGNRFKGPESEVARIVKDVNEATWNKDA